MAFFAGKQRISEVTIQLTWDTVNETLCRDKWPQAMARPLLNQNAPEDWQVLPTSFEGLCDSVYVDTASCSLPRLLMAHPQIEQDGLAMEFAIRVQGIVAETNLSVLGDWTG